MKNKKGQLTFKILDFLVKNGLTARAYLLASLTSGKSSYVLGKKLQKELKRSESDYCEFLDAYRFSNLVSKLKREGLIKSDKKNLLITNKGLEKHGHLTSYLVAYPKEKDDQIKIVTFDIPEKERGQRAWLRGILRELDFYPLQQSVWIGKTKLPSEFMEELESRFLLSKVHILIVSKEGTLENFSINLD